MSFAELPPASMATALRVLAMDAVEAANSGHPGMPMGMADVAAVLFTRHLKFDPTDPHWADRDRFVLSAGHGSMLIYALLHLTGYADMPLTELKRFRQLGAATAGHPEYGHAAGIETTTGPLGQGIATAVGMAIAERLLNARYGDELVDHRTYVIAGDGCLMEGISHEACSLAGHLKLNRLIVLWDDNGISIDGKTSIAVSDDTGKRFESYGWNVLACDGHDPAAVDAALTKAKASDRPTLIACKTVIGKGAPNKAGSHSVHGAPLGKAEIEAARATLGWTHAPFELPDDVVALWRKAGSQGAATRAAWTKRLAAAPAETRATFERTRAGKLPPAAATAMAAYKKTLAEIKPNWASRKSSEEALKVLTREIPELIGGSADLTGSNNTKTEHTAPVQAGSWGGRYLHYGVREHGMMAAMNGIALHGGLIPYGGTFLVFADYCRPSIRLAALMHQRVVLVATHDSIGLGEDGPTHQPVEHLASLRAMPGVLVMRPADAMETAECWEAALEHADRPTVMALSRQNLPALRHEASDVNLSAKGAYVLVEAQGARAATILATGSEVSLAVEAQKALAAEGIQVAVVSMPSWELFAAQDQAYRDAVLGTAPRIAVEAAVAFGWSRWTGSDDRFVGMPGFGASGPAPDLFRHFGITAEAVAAKVKSLI